MQSISVKKIENLPDAKFLVEIANSNKTRHKVTLNNDYYQKLTNGKISPKKLIKVSFKFLLKREASTSILSIFNLNQIQDYFPEYENTIQKELGA